jgi:hypothetical protein
MLSRAARWLEVVDLMNPAHVLPFTEGCCCSHVRRAVEEIIVKEGVGDVYKAIEIARKANHDQKIGLVGSNILKSELGLTILSCFLYLVSGLLWEHLFGPVGHGLCVDPKTGVG